MLFTGAKTQNKLSYVAISENFRLAGGFGAGFQSASAISFWGPKEGFESDNNGYDRMYEIAYPANSWILFTPEFTYAPHNLQEEFRWNVPVLYYTFDASFLEYFGSNGVAAVDSAMRILNSLPKASDMSSDLSEFPLDEAHFNFSGMPSTCSISNPQRWRWCSRASACRPGALDLVRAQPSAAAWSAMPGV